MVERVRLIASTVTDGWTDWVPGTLWLHDQGLLRVRSTSRGPACDPLRFPKVDQVALTAHEAALAAAEHRGNLWLRRDELRRAVLRRGLTTDTLRLHTLDGRKVKLQWRAHERADDPLVESLEAWLGPELDVRGLPRRPARHAHRRRLGAGLLSVWLAGAVGMVAAVTWLRPADPCAEVEDLAAAADAPSAETPAPIVGSALLHTLLVGVGEEFTQVFEGLQDLEGHAASQHNPDARTLAQAHGFQQQATRQWSDPQGNAALSHIVVQLDSPADAAAFNVEIARYSCTFADEVWSVPANSRVSAPVIGQRLRYGDGSVAEQLSWAQDGRRHLIVHYHRGGQPDRDLVVRLQAQAMLRG